MASNAYNTIVLEQKDRVAHIILNRPELHNAFNSEMITEMASAFKRIGAEESVRVIVLTGRGKSFCAGADLNWMREIIHYSYEQNLEESMQVAALLHRIYFLPKPTIAMVNGTAIGGGTGFLSVCDIAIASEEAKFGLSEVKIGLIPAAIGPYVIRKIGESKAREYFLTGRRITAKKAMEIGLVNDVVAHAQLQEKTDEIVDLFLSSGPEAIAKCKELIFRVPHMSFEEAIPYTAEMIANLRASEEGQEGMAAFLEKRRPHWADKKEVKKQGEKKKTDK